MIFKFKCNPKVDMSDTEIYTDHIENILELGYFKQKGSQIPVNGFGFKDTYTINTLFSNPKNRLWTCTEPETTKNWLKKVRKSDDPDIYYDHDVLRLTEPRILFLRESISRFFNSEYTSKTPEKFICSESPINLQKAFEQHISWIKNNVVLYCDEEVINPEEFVFSRYPDQDAITLDLTLEGSGYDSIDESFYSAFSSIISVSMGNDGSPFFSLRNYDHWTTKSSGEPFEILGVLSKDCNAKCDFCYVLGNPSNTAVKLVKFTSNKSGEEALVRLEYFKRGLKLPIPTYDTEEITTHPDFYSICDGIRQVSNECISITTNGYTLTEENVKKLAKYKPITISLSLNATKPETRKWLMRGHYRRGLESLHFLHKYRIPCAVTIVAWPRVQIDEIIESVRYVDQFNARSISVLLGGYTKLFPNPPEYRIPEYWNEVIDKIQYLREEIETPFIIQPRLYEEQYAYPKETLGCSRIIGVNKFSSAKLAGLKVNDVIINVNNQPILSRNQCLSLLSINRKERNVTSLIVKRKGKKIRFNIDPDNYDNENYIYDEPFNDIYGLHLMGQDLKISSIREIFKQIELYKARRILLLTSMIVKPFLVNALKKYAPVYCKDSIEFDLQVPPNNFLGGNIIMGDMLVLDDFYEFIETYLKTNKIDLVLIPSGPFNYGGWLRDMKGQPFVLLQYAFNIPVEIIKAPYFE